MQYVSYSKLVLILDYLARQEASLRNQYEKMSEYRLGGELVDIALQINRVLFPVSPVKIMILMAQAFGEQGPDARVITPKHFGVKLRRV